MAVTNAITDLIKSFYELIVSVLGTAYSVVEKTVQAVFSFISGLFTLVGDITSGIVDVTGGVGKFVAGNIGLITVGALAAFVYVGYTTQGRQLAAGKKPAKKTS